MTNPTESPISTSLIAEIDALDDMFYNATRWVKKHEVFAIIRQHSSLNSDGLIALLEAEKINGAEGLSRIYNTAVDACIAIVRAHPSPDSNGPISLLEALRDEPRYADDLNAGIHRQSVTDAIAIVRQHAEQAITQQPVDYASLTAGDFLQAVGMDGMKWADAFMQTWGFRMTEVDHGLMIGWFCNAIMAGYDEALRRAVSEREAQQPVQLAEAAETDSIISHFRMLWRQYGLARDEELTQGAIRLKHKMLAAVESLGVPKQEVSSGWQPIETAPRDGMRVDLWVIHPDRAPYRVTDCKWTEHHGWRMPSDAPVEGFCDKDGHCLIRPTHWMPLPAPPVSEATVQEE